MAAALPDTFNMPTIDSAIHSVLDAQAAATQQQIAYALLAKAQAATKIQGQAIANLLQQAATMGKAVGKGQQLDTVG